MLRIRKDPVLEFDTPIPNDTDGRVEADAVRICAAWSPGICVVSKAGIPFTWDKRKGYGLSGAWLIFTGIDLAEFDVTFTVWRQDQMDAWKIFQKMNLSKPPAQPQAPAAPTTASSIVAGALSGGTSSGGFLPNVPRPPALGIYNPILAELGINKCVVKYIGQWNHAGLPRPGMAGPSIGRWEKTVSFYQWEPPIHAIGRPDSAVPETGPRQPTAADAKELENRGKRLQIEKIISGQAKGLL